MLKVLMISRSTLYSSPGGDTVQIKETAAYLEKIGISVDIRLSSEIGSYDKYDILHFFNIIRPNDILYHIKASNKPFVVSTIFVDYSEYDKKFRKGLIGKLRSLLSSDFFEYIKVIGRSLLNNEKVLSKEYYWLGHKRSIIKIAQRAHMILPNSLSEYNRFYNAYGVKVKYKVVPNGINQNIFNKRMENPSLNVDRRKIILCVGRIEGIKNQLNLIKALNNTEIQLYIIGKPGPNSANYYLDCRKAANSNVVFLNHIEQENLISYYQKAKVHVLPSWFETTGLSSLEAGIMGCNLVVTDKGDTKDYFQDYAFYCEPGDINSIRETVLKAYNSPMDDKLANHIERNFTWNRTAEVTKNAYNEALNAY